MEKIKIKKKKERKKEKKTKNNSVLKGFTFQGGKKKEQERAVIYLGEGF